MGFLATILGFLNGLFSFGSKILEYIKANELINRGKADQQADIAKDEIIINREQTAILTKEVTKEDTIKKMKDGTF